MFQFYEQESSGSSPNIYKYNVMNTLTGHGFFNQVVYFIMNVSWIESRNWRKLQNKR